MSIEAVAQAIQQEAQSGVTDATRSPRVRRGVYSMRDKTGFYMIRTRIPAGLITPEQLEAIATVAEEVAWPLGVHLTTRQGLEIPGAPADKVVSILQRLETRGITTYLTGGNAVRAVVSCPLSGVTPDEVFDVTPHALATDRYFHNKEAFQQMGRKFKIAFDGCQHDDHVRTLATDLGARAATQAGRRGFTVVVGGGLGATPKIAHPLEAFTAEEDLFSTIEAVLRVFARHGNRENRARARLKWLIEEKGIEWFRAEVLKERALVVQEGGLPAPSWPVIAESLSKASEVLATETAPTDAAYELWKATNVHAQKQTGLVTVWVRVPHGDLLVSQLRQIAAIAKRFAGGLRFSIEQDIVLRHVAEAALPALYAALQQAELSACCAGQLADITRCAGSDTCLSALTNSRGAANNIAKAISGDLAQDPVLKNLRVRVSGCPNSCSHHHAADIGVFGLSKQYFGRSVPHYALVLGGNHSGGAAGIRVIEVPALRVGQAVKATLLYYRSERATDETFTAFVQRVGAEALQKKLVALAQVPPPEKAPACYRDLGADGDFRIGAKRGECAA